LIYITDSACNKGDTMVDEKGNDIILKNINATRNRIISFEQYMISRSWGLFFSLFAGVIFLYAYLEPLLSYVIMPDYVHIIAFLIDSLLLVLALLYWLHIYGKTLRFLRLKNENSIGSSGGLWKRITLVLVFILIAVSFLSSYIPPGYEPIVEMAIQSFIFLVMDFIIIRSVKSSLSKIPGVVYIVVISFLFIVIIPLIVDFTSILPIFDDHLLYYSSFAIIVFVWLTAGISMIYGAPDYLEVDNGQ
jgi:hypothetical protein